MCQRLLQASWPQCAARLSLLCGFQGRKSMCTQAFWFSCLPWHGRLYVHSVCMCIERERESKAMHTLTLYTCMLHTIWRATWTNWGRLQNVAVCTNLFLKWKKDSEATNSAKHLHGILITSEHEKVKRCQKHILVTPLGNWEPPALLPACPLCKEPLQHSCCCVYYRNTL